MSLVKNIKSLCDRENIRLEHLSKELGWGENSIYRWDKNSPSVDKLQKVAEHFNVTIDSLMAKTFYIKDIEDSDSEIKEANFTLGDDPYILLSEKARESGIPLDVLETLIKLYANKKDQQF